MKKDYNKSPIGTIKGINNNISTFTSLADENMDSVVVEDFGKEWLKFNEHSIDNINLIGKEYFDIVNDDMVNKNTYLLDIGCGTGRWSKFFVDKAGFIEAIDPSDAILVADKLIGEHDNVRLTKASVDTLPWKDETFDFVMSIGVLHHIPDTRKALFDAVKKVKLGGYFYTYLYYNFDNRGIVFKTVFHIANGFRLAICRMPDVMKKPICDTIALTIYWPLSRFAGLLKKMKLNSIANKIPLQAYSNKPLYNLRNDSLDRFGTRLEQRFSKQKVKEMMENAGLSEITFGENSAYWHAVGKRTS